MWAVAQALAGRRGPLWIITTPHHTQTSAIDHAHAQYSQSRAANRKAAFPQRLHAQASGAQGRGSASEHPCLPVTSSRDEPSLCLCAQM